MNLSVRVDYPEIVLAVILSNESPATITAFYFLPAYRFILLSAMHIYL